MSIELPEKFEDGLGYLVHQLMYGLRRNFIRESERAGMRVTPEEMVVVVLLYQRGGLTQTELAGTLAKDKAVITRMLAQLQKRGLVRREADAGDRRVVRSYLTDEGKKSFEELQPLLDSFIRRAIEGLSQAEFDFTRLNLRRIIDNLEAME
ncbi:MAG TPA: MarR family transcriptional regulator [Mariprofundaceae bacterium]|nr:MarR family transcriptional regulator [Mariprofundaceae bacterium]